MLVLRKIGILITVTVLFLMPVWAEDEEEPLPPEGETESPIEEQEEPKLLSESEAAPEPEPEPETRPAAKWIDKYGLSLFPLCGLLIGQGEEILYKYPDGDQFASQLLWDLKPLVYLGVSFDFGLLDPYEKHGMFASASFRYGLPLKTGTMENRDWMNPNHDSLTDFSTHDAYSTNAIMLDISAGYAWPLKGKLTLGAYGEFTYMHFAWSGENGYGQYSNGTIWSGSLFKDMYYGTVILYSQNWVLFSPGIRAKWKINNYFSLDGNVSYSPLIYCTARDDHLFTNVVNWDYPLFGHHFSAAARVGYSLFSKTEIFLSLAYRLITGSRGVSYNQDTGFGVTGKIFKNELESGAGHSALDVRLGIRINIF